MIDGEQLTKIRVAMHFVFFQTEAKHSITGKEMRQSFQTILERHPCFEKPRISENEPLASIVFAGERHHLWTKYF
jgi:hypothetical protein